MSFEAFLNYIRHFCALQRNNELIKNAKEISTQLQTKEITFIRQASETGQLYGSVSPKDISNYFKESFETLEFQTKL